MSQPNISATRFTTYLKECRQHQQAIGYTLRVAGVYVACRVRCPTVSCL